MLNAKAEGAYPRLLCYTYDDYMIDYEYDAYGNRTKKVYKEFVNDKWTPTTTEYTYDLNNKLLSSSTGNADGLISSEKYYYDEMGNLYTKQSSVYSNTGELSSQASLSELAVENGIESYRYDGFNRLVYYKNTNGIVEYSYNADNLRTTKTADGTVTDYVWDGQNLASETTGDVVNTYTYDAGGVYIENKNGTVQSYLKDYHNNVTAHVDATGQIVDASADRTYYSAFGEVASGIEPDPFGYCGEYHDAEI